MDLYVDAASGTDTAGATRGVSWATAYLTPSFALQDLWDSHGRDTTTDPAQCDTINCLGVFTPSTAYSATLSPNSSLSRRVYFLARGKFAVDDGLRTEINAADGIWTGSTQDRIHWFGFYFTWNNSATTQKGFHFDRDCAIMNCVIDGRDAAGLQSPIQAFYYFNFYGNQMIRGRHSINGTIGIRFQNNYFRPTDDFYVGIGGYRGGEISNNVIIWNCPTTNPTGRQIYAAAGVPVFGNTCLNLGNRNTSQGIYLASESWICYDNYMQGFANAIVNSTYKWFIQNNTAFDCTILINAGSRQPVTPTITALTSAMYADPANGDWTITNADAASRLTKPWGGIQRQGAVQQIAPQLNNYNPFGGS